MTCVKRAGLIAAASFFLAGQQLSAQAPSLINYQGRLLNGTNLYSGTANLTFRLFNTNTGGSALFVSTNVATVVDGLYATAIGEFVTAGSLDAALTNAQVWLEIEVNGTTMTPRERVLAVPYARVVHGLYISPSNSVVLNAKVGTNSIDLTARHSVVGGGQENTIQTNSSNATIGGGRQNSIRNNAEFATIDGGYLNSVAFNADYAAVGGGNLNTVGDNSAYSVLGGGFFNDVAVNSLNVVIAGGFDNDVGSSSSGASIGGGANNDIGDGSVYSVIGGGYDNNIAEGSLYATIGGGHLNAIQLNATNATIGGGDQNSIRAGAAFSTIGGGYFNTIQTNARHAAIGGGSLNSIDRGAQMTTIGGGEQNSILFGANFATIGGGFFNVIQSNAVFATIPGGIDNSATNYAFAAGRRAKANHTGSFVWGDSTDTNVTSTASNQVTFRASGGFRIFTNPGLSTGVQVAANSGAWTSISDVNAKEGFQPVNPAEVLEKVVSLPISTWRYKGQSEEIRHMGPTAQDFYAAFGLGDLPGTGITSIDPDGVALAAIQALAGKVSEDRGRLAELEAENVRLRKELEEIKRRTGL